MKEMKLKLEENRSNYVGFSFLDGRNLFDVKRMRSLLHIIAFSINFVFFLIVSSNTYFILLLDYS
jgi:hypothetical protein